MVKRNQISGVVDITHPVRVSPGRFAWRCFVMRDGSFRRVDNGLQFVPEVGFSLERLPASAIDHYFERLCGRVAA